METVEKLDEGELGYKSVVRVICILMGNDPSAIFGDCARKADTKRRLERHEQILMETPRAAALATRPCVVTCAMLISVQAVVLQRGMSCVVIWGALLRSSR